MTTVLEAKRLAYEDMAKFYGDPRFVKIPLEALLSEAYAAERRKLINPERPDPALGPGDPQLRIGDTTYLTVADKDGMMVSLIQSNYSGLGSGLVADHLGFMFHNRANLFSLDAEIAQWLCARQAPIPHAHPRLRHEGRRALPVLRRDGRRHAGAGPSAGAGQHHRLRHEHPGRRRCRALVSRRHGDGDRREIAKGLAPSRSKAAIPRRSRRVCARAVSKSFRPAGTMAPTNSGDIRPSCGTRHGRPIGAPARCARMAPRWAIKVRPAS